MFTPRFMFTKTFKQLFTRRKQTHPIFIEEPSPPRARSKRTTRFWLLITASFIGLTLFFAHEAAASDTQSAGSDEGGESGHFLLQASQTNQPIKSLPIDTQVTIDVSGMVAKVRVEQSFINTGNQWAHGTYVFPLPEKSAVNRMRMRIGERSLEGEIKEKREAEKIYQAAKQAGKKASLVRQERPNLFTTKVANIAPQENITVVLEYIQSVAYINGEFSLRFPMTVTRRYIPGQTLRAFEPKNHSVINNNTSSSNAGNYKPMGWALNTTQVADANLISPHSHSLAAAKKAQLNPVRITASVDVGMALSSIKSLYHDIDWQKNGSQYTLSLRQAKVPMNQDFVLSWRPLAGSEPTAAVFSETVAGDTYGLLMLVPPSAPDSASALQQAKEVIYVVDTSGSMGGVSIEQARQSLAYAVSQLRPQDRFNIIEFNSNSRQFFPNAVAASQQNTQRAQQYISQLASGGGTEMLPALQQALAHQAPEGFVRQVIFITDGAIGNDAALFAEIHNTLGNSRLFTVGIGSAPNSHFMRKAAEFGRGRYTYIGSVDHVKQTMMQLLDSLSRPQLTDINISWPNQAETYPARIPDLYSGEPLLVSAKLASMQGDTIIEGKIAGRAWRQVLSIKGDQQHSGIAQLWAREKIASLLDQKVGGADAEAIRLKVLPVALQHQLVSPYTSFVAVEKKVSRPAEQTALDKTVLNAPPKGQVPQPKGQVPQPTGQVSQPMAYPKTATRSLENLLLGFCLILLAVIFSLAICKEEQHDLVD